ncbi:MAG: hypothetical protein ABW217_07295 [Polyangiaceae bacterium]
MRWLAWALCALWIVVVSPASAQETAPPATNAKELARQRFREATEAYNDGRFSSAASLFEAADRLSPHAATRYNAATAWDQAGEASRAATGYEAALAQGTLDTSRETIARDRLATLKGTLAHVRVLQPLGALVTVDHVQRTPVPTSFFLRPGRYEVTTEYRGARTTTPARVVAGKDHILKLNVPFTEVVTPPPAAAPPVTAPSVPPDVPPSDASLQRTWGWIAVGAGVVFSGAAIYMGTRTLAARDEYRSSGFTSQQARDTAASRRLATNVFWGGALLSGGAGAVLLLTSPKVEF